MFFPFNQNYLVDDDHAGRENSLFENENEVLTWERTQYLASITAVEIRSERRPADS